MKRVAHRDDERDIAAQVSQPLRSPALQKHRPVALVMVTWKAPEPAEQSYGYTQYDSEGKPTEKFSVKKSGDSVEIFWEKSPTETKQKSGGEDIENNNRA